MQYILNVQHITTGKALHIEVLRGPEDWSRSVTVIKRAQFLKTSQPGAPCQDAQVLAWCHEEPGKLHWSSMVQRKSLSFQISLFYYSQNYQGHIEHINPQTQSTLYSSLTWNGRNLTLQPDALCKRKSEEKAWKPNSAEFKEIGKLRQILWSLRIFYPEIKWDGFQE